jgi:hypothetical protein
VPKEIIVVEKLPLLGTGKVDYVGVKELIPPNQNIAK